MPVAMPDGSIQFLPDQGAEPEELWSPGVQSQGMMSPSMQSGQKRKHKLGTLRGAKDNLRDPRDKPAPPKTPAKRRSEVFHQAAPPPPSDTTVPVETPAQVPQARETSEEGVDRAE